MSLHLWYRSPSGIGAWTEVDLISQRAVDVKLTVAYSHPATLSWSMLQRQHEAPIPYLSDVCFVDTDFYDPGSLTNPELFSGPVFEGHVKEIQPAGSNELRYLAMDPTDRAGQEVSILSSGDSRIPRLVYNAKIETDDDYAFSRELDATVGAIIEDLLGDPVGELVMLLAAPPSGATPFLPADLTPFDFIPQEKLVFETEGLRSGLDRILEWYPSYRIVFHPGAAGGRLWRFRNVKQAPRLTLTLNDHATPGGKRVLSLDLQRSIEQRYTAVEILGPLQHQYGLASVLSEAQGGPAEQTAQLNPLWDSVDEAETLANGPDILLHPFVSTRWQIDDADKRALSRVLPREIAVPYTELGFATEFAFKRTRQPSLLVTYDDGATYETVGGIELDIANGIVRAPRTIIRNVANQWVQPDNVLFHFAWYGSALTARAPADGYSGTAHEAFGIRNVLRRFDEALVTGWDKNDQFVTEQERIDEFRKLAQNLLEAHHDVVYAGATVLEGIDYDFLRLDRRVDFAAVDASGAPLVTGWEQAGAIVTDVEFDYSEKLTTLTLSSDHLEFTETDPAALRELLKIQALGQQQRIRLTYKLGDLLLIQSSAFTSLSGDFKPLKPIS